ncbi:MAG: type II secretion system protein [Lachnospiraceae bacterium]|nr:type II secretion system protein [Lachnospiraceae bacterium]
MKKKNQNKGFSLVELIVVVLIMGILTMALAPQVMKWVVAARESADARAKDNLKSVGQAAIADYEGTGGTLADANYIVTSGGISAVGGTDPNVGMIALLTEYTGGDKPQVQNESGKVFQIEIQDTGLVTVSTVSGTY